MPRAERRSDERFQVTEISAEVYEGSQQRWPTVNGRVLDLAASGMKLDLYMRVRLEKDTPVYVNFSLPNGFTFVRKKARVAWKSFKPRTARMGLEFLDAPAADREKIRSFLFNRTAKLKQAP